MRHMLSQLLLRHQRPSPSTMVITNPLPRARPTDPTGSQCAGWSPHPVAPRRALGTLAQDQPVGHDAGRPTWRATRSAGHSSPACPPVSSVQQPCCPVMFSASSVRVDGSGPGGTEPSPAETGWGCHISGRYGCARTEVGRRRLPSRRGRTCPRVAASPRAAPRRGELCGRWAVVPRSSGRRGRSCSRTGAGGENTVVRPGGQPAAVL